MIKRKFKIFVFLVCVSICCTSSINAQEPRGKLWGQTLANSGSPGQVLFRLFRNNIAGQSFYLTLPGECTYFTDGEAPITAENTFTFSYDDFPDLLVNRRGRVLAEVSQAVSDTGHTGTLTIDCRFRRSAETGKYNRALCSFEFQSPRSGEQLDECIAGLVLNRVRTSRP